MTVMKSSEARADWADLLNRVGYGGERIEIERRGKKVAVLISPEDAELLQVIEDKIEGELARRVLEEDEREPVPLEDAIEEAGL